MVDAQAIARVVHRVIPEIATGLRPDVSDALKEALARETSARAREVLGQLVENDEIARADAVPVCQDTGTVWVWVELGAEERLGSDLQSAIDEAVANTFREAGLRMSVARDALTDRTNTGDNTPAFVDVTIRPGEGATVHVMLKGGGSDNASAVAMLEPASGESGVRDFVVDTVASRAAGACPPVVVGVGVGATFDKVASLAKRALLRPVGAPPPESTGGIEREILDAVNASGVGPAGLGGDTTALAVHVLTAPCHIAALPVAVDMGCVAMRSATVEVR